jgi:hypothetical protein
VLRLEARDEQALRAVSAEVHDWFFDLDDVTLDVEREQVVVPFRRWDDDEARQLPANRPLHRLLDGAIGRARWQAPWYRWYLRIMNATAYTVSDEDELGGADFNAVAYDVHSRRVKVIGNPPLFIEVTVHDLHVVVEQTRQRLGSANYSTLLGGRSYSGRVLRLD